MQSLADSCAAACEWLDSNAPAAAQTPNLTGNIGTTFYLAPELSHNRFAHCKELHET